MQQPIVEQNRDNVLSSWVGETFGPFGAFGTFGTFGTARSLPLPALFALLSAALDRVPQSALVGVLDCLLQVPAVPECKHRHHVRKSAQRVQGWV